jgi:hypothetical protein
MTTYDRIDAIFQKRGWVCVNECFCYRDTGRLVHIDRVMRAMPEDVMEDIVAA